MKKILLAEDDFDFGAILKQYLELQNFSVNWAKDGEEALHLIQKNTYDICVLDVMMPKLDGFSLAEKIIELYPEIPFVFLTARNQNDDKIKGLKLGADDYIVKPFEADELVLRISNIIKRTQKRNPIEALSNEIQIGIYIFDTNRFELKYNQKTQQLTEKEACLLLFLFQHKNQLVKRELVLKAVWKNEDYFSGRSMDVFISKLRKYLIEDKTIAIESIRNVGLEFKIL
ncbi:response regulator transcription factor [Flavobacterium sp. SUN052]|uniref:response regulator transcription factor n=1 Tax=Flavobacterium sp. SUN052 TaxID=3002441 RepID=UPI00237D3DDD|nr:response regulator transcription factor [Flavobacterium sp. SUN052]MEC4005212.1 response regulator transcription factor [Flavobacterium sp. SUN052]